MKRVLLGVFSLLLLGAGCASDPSAPVIKMTNHTLSKANTFTVDTVVAKNDGWLVLQNEINAKPSEVLAYAPIKVGENKNITFTINRDDATARQYVTLYKDVGKIGTFETADSKESAFLTEIQEEPVLNAKDKLVQIIFLAEVEE